VSFFEDQKMVSVRAVRRVLERLGVDVDKFELEIAKLGRQTMTKPPSEREIKAVERFRVRGDLAELCEGLGGVSRAKAYAAVTRVAMYQAQEARRRK